jgi:hypothetical protein
MDGLVDADVRQQEGTHMTAPRGSGELLYRLNDRDEIVFVNESWSEFAKANGGEGLIALRVLGQQLWSFITDATTRQLYYDVLKRVRAGRQIQFQFRCDSPSRRRLLEMTVLQAAGGVIEFHTRMIREEHREYQALLEPDRAHSDEFLPVCAWCKKVDIGGTWAEVEEAVTHLGLFERPLLPQLTHGICQVCYTEMMKLLEKPGGVSDRSLQTMVPRAAE